MRNYCGVPTVPFVPAPLFITLFLHKGTPAVSARQKYNCSFHRLEIKSCYSIGSPYMFFVRFIYTLFMQVHYRLLITNQSHPNRQQNTIVMFDKNYLFLNQNFHEVYKWTALPPFHGKHTISNSRIIFRRSFPINYSLIKSLTPRLIISIIFSSC